jgi:hypothetical protein
LSSSIPAAVHCKNSRFYLLSPKRLGRFAKRLMTVEPYVVEEPHVLGKFLEGPSLNATRKPNAERAEGIAER